MKKNDGKNAKAKEKPAARRLLLKKETIRSLTEDELKGVHGGHEDGNSSRNPS
jgi:hypothetical protein